MKSIWIAAGGTGGHISPAVSLCYEFNERGCKVTLFTLPRNIEYPDIKSLVFHPTVDVVSYPAPLMPTRPVSIIKFFPLLIKCWFTMLQQKKVQRPDAIIGMGGFPSFPATLFSKASKTPLFLCEQNSIAGKITRLMKNHAKKVFLSFQQENYTNNEVLTGNPIRSIFREEKILKKSKSSKVAKKQIKVHKLPQLFFIGGSQGAKDLNQLYIYLIQNNLLDKFKVIISTGKKDLLMVEQNSRSIDEVKPFIENMPEVLKQSDFIIARAGSSTIFEILWALKPAIFIPFPHATDDHQKINAEQMKKLGIAEIIDIRPFDIVAAARQLLEILLAEKFQKKEIAQKYQAIPFIAKAQTKIVDIVLENI